MKEIIQEILYIIEQICEYYKKTHDIILNKELILNLNSKLQQYTNEYLVNIDKTGMEGQNIWIEMLTDCMNAIENKDNVLLVDTLKYGIKPFISNTGGN